MLLGYKFPQCDAVNTEFSRNGRFWKPGKQTVADHFFFAGQFGVTAFADTDMWQITHIEDMSRILQELEHWEHKTICKETDVLQTVTVHHRYEDEEIPIYTPTTIEMDLRDDYDVEVIFNMPDEITSTNEGQILEANYSILINGETLYEKGLFVSVPREPNIFARFLNWIDQLFN